MKILNWNTEANKKLVSSGKPQILRDYIESQDADAICLTEAFPEYLPDHGHMLCSGKSGWGWPEEQGARKVLLWSRNEWSEVDDIGASGLPPGRFIRAVTQFVGVDWTIIGMCIPWHGYGKASGFSTWQGACDYLDGLLKDVLPTVAKTPRTLLVGDFNLQIPPVNYPNPRSKSGGELVNDKRKKTFSGWLIPTSGIRKHFVDHIAMSTDLRVGSMRFIRKLRLDGKDLNDHNGVFMEIVPDKH